MQNSSYFTQPDEMKKSRSWTAGIFSKPENLPVSFCYDGQMIQGIPESWNPTEERVWIDANIRQTVYQGKDPAGELVVRLEYLEYRDFPVVEWTAWLSNPGTKPTSIVSDFLGIDASFAGNGATLTHCNGDFYNETGYMPTDTFLEEGKTLRFAPAGGRPCDQAFPYYRVTFADCGLTLAVGWPGQWSASFEQTGTGVKIQAGQEKTHLRLLPGETIRSPRMTLLSWLGNEERAINLWRRWYLSHVLPRPDGKPIQPYLAVHGTDDGEEFTAATEENQLRFLDHYKTRGWKEDVWWIDAGWYSCFNEKRERRWWMTGTWEPDPERFPRGLKPVSDKAAQNGARLLIWMEPERVTNGSWLDRQHPEWLLKLPGEDVNRLLNLGNPDCLEWLVDHVNGLIRDNGIRIYRQDFNFEPLLFWRENEAEDRQGANENFHIQGYLHFWDAILEKNPGLWIDSCSSGGRRNDLETMRRSVPLHYSDYAYGHHAIKLGFQHTLYQWIPYFKDCTVGWDRLKPDQTWRFDPEIDPFSCYCGFAPMLFFTIDAKREDYDFELGKKMIGIWRQIADLLIFGDYYPITPFSKSNEDWMVRQFDSPERGQGCIQAIRLAQCPEGSYTVRLKGIDGEKDYLLENLETGEKQEICGSSLVEDGFKIELPKRSGVIWTYQVIAK
jgi:alpha-galactosidase